MKLHSIAIILVPGFLNSLLGQYFSDDIFETLRAHGARVEVVRGLFPAGGYRQNGKRVAVALNEWCSSEGTWVIAHSAGALYTLAALQHSTCRVRGLVAIASPLMGAKLAPLLGESPLGKAFTFFLPSRWMETQIFEDFEPVRMPGFYKDITPLPYAFELRTVTGQQPVAHGWKERWDAEYLAPYLSFTGNLLAEPSDGVVTVDAAEARALRLPVVGGGMVQPIVEPTVGLDHQEQFRDQRFFNFLHRHATLIRRHQIELYRRLREQIETSKAQ